MGDYAIKLDKIGPETDRVGVKANRLGSMMAAGLPVPKGFVLTTEAYVKFLRHNRIANKISQLLEESHSSNSERVKELSSQIRNLIINGIMPDFIEKNLKEEYQDLSIGRDAKEIGGAALDLIRAGRDNIFVTIRPSPTSGGIVNPDFSGQMKTVLSQRGQSKISEAIRECWASLYSPRAMLFRKRKRVRDMPAMGVIVQKSLEPEKAGYSYTSIPETGDPSRIVIEGSWGFSEIITSGVVSPDEFIISKESGETESTKVRKKTWMNRRNEMTGVIEREPVFRERVNAELLDSKEIRKIFELSARVEKHHGGHPQVIEWCEERGRIFLIDAFHVPDYGIPVEPDPDTGGRESKASGVCVFRGKSKGTARLVSAVSDIGRIEKGDVMITSMTIPEMLPVLEKISGLVTEEGSRSCHAAQVAREFGIPCMVAAEGALNNFKEGEQVIFNASDGKLFDIPVIQEVQPVQQPFMQNQPHVPAPQYGIPSQPQIPQESPQPNQANPVPDYNSNVTNKPDYNGNVGINEPESRIPGGLENEGITATGIKTIVSIPGGIGNSPETSDGVGLIRAEHLITESGKHPYYMIQDSPEEMIAALITGLGSIAKSFYPKPLWYRSLDVRTDEFRELIGGDNEPNENNPIMGWHGIRRSLDQPDILKIEIEVIRKLHAEGLDNIVLGVPFISSVNELRAVKELAGPGIKVGIMVETPAAGLEIDGFCKEGIAFAAIGLNDLTQLTLGVDRDNSSISKLYSELNPAVTNLLKHILRTCRQHSVETSVYGDFVTDSRIAESLVSLGVGSISTEPENLEQVRGIISRTERKLILDNMRNRPPG